ncbi:hypothetical protein PY650_17770 [Rhizobium calliandrae]|uniref:Uncharacterized protein n=1 Tax=Rhizobium calliandrae TaxID=1312182 RepID=A0ABT7KFT2_9HYPH|nr:hypothetical protein [Rhizobium calliandrae]MDL2407481.1 hypothetical protein [Rhizobium calliandrae]
MIFNNLLHQFKLCDAPQATSARPAMATARSKPAAYPPRALGRTVAKAFGGNATSAAVAQDEMASLALSLWEGHCIAG